MARGTINTIFALLLDEKLTGHLAKRVDCFEACFFNRVITDESQEQITIIRDYILWKLSSA